MKIILLVILAAGGTFFIKSRLARRTHEGIEGKWSIVSWPEGWKEVPGSHVNITSSEVKIVIGVIPAKTLKYELDPDEETIDTTQQKGGATVEQLGRYHRDGETLTLCVGGEGKPRPEGLDTTSGGAMKWVLHLTK